MAISVQLPEDVEQLLRSEFPNLERRILEDFATEAFRRGELSSYQVGQILGFEDRWDAMDFLSKRGVYPGYDLEDLEEDRRTVEKLTAKSSE